MSVQYEYEVRWSWRVLENHEELALVEFDKPDATVEEIRGAVEWKLECDGYGYAIASRGIRLRHVMVRKVETTQIAAYTVND